MNRNFLLSLMAAAIFSQNKQRHELPERCAAEAAEQAFLIFQAVVRLNPENR